MYKFKIILFFLVLISFEGIFPGQLYAQSISFSKLYSINPAPNYKEYKKSEVDTILTNGKYADGRIWSSEEGLAWRNTEKVEITIDLREISKIGSVGLHAGAGTSGKVKFPLSALVYLSEDDKNYTYAGEIMNQENSSDNIYYVSRLLKKDRIDMRARFVRLEIFPLPPFFSVDEVEVEKTDSAEPIIANILRDDISLDAVDRVKINNRQREKEQDESILGVSKQEKTDLDLERARQLQLKFPGRPFFISEVPTWSEISPLDIPRKITNPSAFEFILPLDGCDYRSYEINNSSDKLLRLEMRQTVPPVAHASLYEVQKVRDFSAKPLYDPLIPISGHLVLKPGGVSLLLVKFCGKQIGRGAYQLKIEHEKEEEVITGEITTSSIELDKTMPSSATFSYLNGALYANRNEAAIKDLAEHHDSSIVVPVMALNGYLGNSENILKYLRMFKLQGRELEKTKVMLFLGFKKGSAKIHENSWQEGFGLWYQNTMALLKKEGLKNSQIYIYPYDEPSEGAIEEAANFLQWVKLNFPTAKFFMTIDNPKALRLRQYIDISCIQVSVPFTPLPMQETWLYDFKGPAKNNESYAYYRMLPWDAFNRKLQGVGFWSYNDGGGVDEQWSDNVPSKRIRYSVSYIGPNGDVYSGKRWEAWSIGLEDAALLTQYAMKFGAQRASEFSNKVLEQRYNDPSKADAARQEILKALSISQ